MASSKLSRWSEIRDRTLSTPEARDRYRRTRDSVMAIRQLLQEIDAERERAGLSKSELARQAGASPATVRRLFTSPSANPTLKTIIDLFDVLGIGIELRPLRKANDLDDARSKTPKGTRGRSRAG